MQRLLRGNVSIIKVIIPIKYQVLYLINTPKQKNSGATEKRIPFAKQKIIANCFYLKRWPEVTASLA